MLLLNSFLKQLTAASLNGTHVAAEGDQSNVGGDLVVHFTTFADGATANNDIVVTSQIRVLDVVVVKTVGAGGAGDTVQVQTGAGAAISDVIDINDADTTISRAATIDDAAHTIAAGGTLRIRRVDGGGAGNDACIVYVLCMRV